MQLYPKLILDALAKVRYPGNGKDLVANEMIEDDIRIDGNKVSFSIIFDKPTDPFIRSVVKAAETAILTFVSPEVNIKGNIAVKARQTARPNPENPLPDVKNIIAVSSGNRGVGKSTKASNSSGNIRKSKISAGSSSRSPNFCFDTVNNIPYHFCVSFLRQIAFFGNFFHKNSNSSPYVFLT